MVKISIVVSLHTFGRCLLYHYYLLMKELLLMGVIKILGST